MRHAPIAETCVTIKAHAAGATRSDHLVINPAMKCQHATANSQSQHAPGGMNAATATAHIYAANICVAAESLIRQLPVEGNGVGGEVVPPGAP